MQNYRELFPVTEELIYLNHAANAPEPLPVTRAVNALLTDASRRGTLMEEDWKHRPDEIRGLVARLLNCRGDQIAFLNNVSAAASLVTGGLDWQPGDNVVITRDQFPANVYPWMFLKSKGVEVRIADWQRQGFTRSVLDCINERTRVVAVSWVEYFSGTRHALEEVGEYCRAKGILYFVDGIQGLGFAALDSQKISADIIATGGQKWLLGPDGSGAMFCSDAALDRLSPPVLSWRSVENYMNFDQYDLTLKDNAARFEGGTQNYLGMIGLGAALGMLLAVGLDKTESIIGDLVQELYEGLKSLPVELLTPRAREARAGIVTFIPNRGDAEGIRAELAKKKIVVSMRRGALRVSPHFYNTHEENAALLTLLRALL